VATPARDAVPVRGAELEQLARRTITSLRLAQVPGQAAVAGMAAVVTLLAGDLLGSDRFAGTGSAAFTTGAALATIPIAASMRRRGRRPGLTSALLVGAAGAGLAAVGGAVGSFPLFVIGMVGVGSGQAATLLQRYVAGDLVPAERQAAAIAAIVWVGALGAVFGPLLTPFERAAAAAFGLDELVGPFVFAALFFLVAAAVVWRRLRPDPLAVVGGIEPDAERAQPIRQLRRSANAVARSPGATLGLAAMAISQAVMVGVMTMTPPHMDDHGQDDLSAYVIAVHVLGMYGLAPLVGRFVVRAGTVRAIECGAIVLGVGTVSTVLAGYVPALMFSGLFLLGLGWSVGLIGGSTLLTSAVPAEARVEVQGSSDLAMSLCGALAAFGSGFVKQSFGFHLLADGAAALAGALLVIAWLTSARRPSTV